MDGERCWVEDACRKHASHGTEHPNVARDLNNLAQLLKATNRLAEAEPLSRRQLKIFIQFKRRAGHEHPRFQTALGNYIGILEAQGLIKDQVQARIREISIEVAEESGGDRPASPEA